MTLTSRSSGVRLLGFTEDFTALPVVVWGCPRCRQLEFVYDDGTLESS